MNKIGYNDTKIRYNTVYSNILLKDNKWYLISHEAYINYRYLVNPSNMRHFYKCIDDNQWYDFTGPSFNIDDDTDIIKKYDNFAEVLIDYPELIDL